jgi:hypothetical protein
MDSQAREITRDRAESVDRRSASIGETTTSRVIFGVSRSIRGMERGWLGGFLDRGRDSR